MLGQNSASRTQIGILLALFCLLPVLAFLQYRWIGRVSEIERGRLEARLRPATEDLAHGLNRRINVPLNELRRVGRQVQNRQELGEAIAEWWANAPDRSLVINFYLAESVSAKLWVMVPATGHWEPAEWPARFAGVKARLESGQHLTPILGSIPGMSAPAFGPIPAPQDDSSSGPTDDRPPPDDRPPSGDDSDPPPAGEPNREWAIAELNLNYLRTTVLPDLAATYLPQTGDLGYALKIVPESDPGQVIFQSDQNLPGDFFHSPDFTFRLWDVQPPASAAGRPRPRRAERQDEKRDDPRPENRGAWRGYVKHRAGSLDAAVAEARNANLAISLGVLAVLAAALVVLYVTTRRAQWLAKLQIDFIAGVSHELRTPLAVICSASENLSHGVVADPKRVQHYGKLIEGQGRQLSNMVEQMMAFGGVQAGRFVQPACSIDAATVIDEALEASGPELRDAGMTVEKKIAPDLEHVMADPLSLRHAIANLLNNAAKYAGGGKWVGVSAEAVQGGSRRVLRITVEDRGEGIPAADLPHVFEPFFRGQNTQSNTVRGTGLGLSLVKRIMEAHGGQATVESTPGQGSRFTLSLPMERHV